MSTSPNPAPSRPHLTGSQRAFINVPLKGQFDRNYGVYQQIIEGGWASGKTHIGLQKMLFLVAKYPQNQVLFCRRHGADLEKTLIPEFFKQCPSSWIQRVYKRGQTGQVVYLKNGSICYFQQIRDATVKGTKTRITGHTLGAFLVEQAEEISREEWVALNGRLRNPYAKKKFALGNANPAGHDWIYEDFFSDYEPLDPKRGIFYRTYVKGNKVGIHVDSNENRISNGGFIDDDFFENHIRNSPPEFVRRYINASFENFSGKVYTEYTLNSVHNIEPLPLALINSWECLGPIDVGGSCPWGVLDMRVDNYGNIVVVNEYAEATAVVGHVASWIKHNMPYDSSRTTFVIDPENKVAAEDLSREGIYCRTAIKHVFAGTMRVASYLTRVKGRKAPKWLRELQPEKAAQIDKEGCPRLFFVNTCTKVRGEHDKVTWHPSLANQIHKTSEVRYDLVDCCRYGVATLPEPSKIIPVDDMPELRERDPASAHEAEVERKLYAAAKNRSKSTSEMFLDGNEWENRNGFMVPAGKWEW